MPALARRHSVPGCPDGCLLQRAVTGAQRSQRSQRDPLWNTRSGRRNLLRWHICVPGVPLMARCKCCARRALFAVDSPCAPRVHVRSTLYRVRRWVDIFLAMHTRPTPALPSLGFGARTVVLGLIVGGSIAKIVVMVAAAVTSFFDLSAKSAWSASACYEIAIFLLLMVSQT